jgi:NAD+ diphosphatase
VREMWEEAGVKVWNVTYHSAQPWVSLAISPALYTHCPQPFPANLMVGFYARADASQPIRLDLDNELMGKSSLLPPPLAQSLIVTFRRTMVHPRRSARSFEP